MGLDKDKFKIWVPNKFRKAVHEEIVEIIRKERVSKAADYLTKLEVIGLKQRIQFERDAGIAILPGHRLHLSNGKDVSLTAFFVAGTHRYALSTTQREPHRSSGLLQY